MLKSFIKTKNGKPTLFIEDKPVAAMAYTTYFTERSCCEDFIKAGYRIFFVNASFTALPINSVATGFTPFRIGIFEDPVNPDYSEFEPEVRKILKACPDAIIFPRLYVSMPSSWVSAHIDECVPTNKGGYRESLFSEAFRRDGEELIVRFINHIKESDYASRIGGWQICGGQTQEWFHHDYMGSLSESALLPFGKWVKEKFGDTEVKLPKKEDFAFDGIGIKHNENARRYAMFCNEKVAETIDFFGKVIKRETDGTQIVGAFYGYSYENNNTVLFGTHGLRCLLDSDSIDFLSSPNAYIEARRFGIDWSDMMPVDSVTAHGKLPFIECDIRTYLTCAIQEARPGEYPDDIYRTEGGGSVWVGPPTRELSVLALRKSFAHQLTKRAAIWWFDMWGGWYDDPLLMEELKRLKELYDGDLQKKNTEYPRAEVAFFADERGYSNMLCGAPQLSGIPKSRTAMGCTGAPYDTVTVEDAERLLPNYKAAVFPFPLPSEAGKAAISLCKRLNIPYICADWEHYLLSVSEIKEFLKRSGVHFYSEENDIICLGGGYIALHSDRGGKKTLHLPKSCRASAVFGAEESIYTADAIEFELEENGTALFTINKE
ncbi:MAG: hypothetical protein J6V09_07425 [Clostridia bacterium]|nr:hypothetical protein [Clostridia bacterium]